MPDPLWEGKKEDSNGLIVSVESLAFSYINIRSKFRIRYKMLASTFQNPASGAPTPNSQTQVVSSQPLPPNNQHAIIQPPQRTPPAVPANFMAQYPGPHTQWSPQLHPPSKAEIEEKPWKYLGYPGFATWGASSKDAFVLRRFNAVHTRVILYMQDQIVRKEEELEALDRRCRTRPDDVDNGTFRYDMEPRRNAVLDDLRVRLKEYSKQPYPMADE